MENSNPNVKSINEKNINELTNWYATERPNYKDLAFKVESIITEVLNNENFNYFSISSRAKDLDSFVNKAKKDKYKDPKSEIMDFAGIRIITYVKSEVTECCDIIKPLFDIDSCNSLDKSNELGNNMMGYRSVHYVAKLSEDRLKLPEYSRYKDMCFEIQVRTILEHAWADISHDKNYKFNGTLPDDIQRRFNLIAATLELSDREFDSISNEISKYQIEVEEKIDNNDLDIEINSTSLTEYMNSKFKKYTDDFIINPVHLGATIVSELRDFQITNLSDLNTLIDKHIDDYIKNYCHKAPKGYVTYLGLLRDLMCTENIDLYFNKCWNNAWDDFDIWLLEYFHEKNIDFDKYISKYSFHELDY